MSSATAYNAIRAFLEANWTTTPLRFENENLDPPADGSAFVYMECEGGLFDQASIGGGLPSANLWREEGTLFLDVMVASGNKTKTLLGRTYREQLAALFQGRQLSPGITFRAIAFGLGAPSDANGNYFALPLTAEFFRDQ